MSDIIFFTRSVSTEHPADPPLSYHLQFDRALQQSSRFLEISMISCMPYVMVIACLSTEFRITFTGHVIPAVIVVGATPGPIRAPHAASRRVTIRFRLRVKAEHAILPFRAEFLVSPGVPLPALGRIEDNVVAACRLVAPLEDVAIIARRSATRIITSQEKITAIALPAVGRRG